MVERKALKNTPLLATIFINILLIIAVLFLMNYVTKLLESDARINLTEIVSQNKDVITSKLKLEVNNLDMASDQISERLSQTKGDKTKKIQDIFYSMPLTRRTTGFLLRINMGMQYFLIKLHWIFPEGSIFVLL